MKRFTATEKWEKQWFTDLSLKHKCLWNFLCDKCDHAGVWSPNYRLASFLIGEQVTEDDIRKLGDQIAFLPDGKVLILGFIQFQYGKLSRDCKPHSPVFLALEKHNISADSIAQAEAFKNTVDSRLREKIIARDESTCVYTGRKLLPDEIEIDHVVPRSKGGTNKPSNLAVMDKALNQIKSDLTLEAFCERVNMPINETKERLSKALHKPLIGFQSLQVQEEEEETDRDKDKEEDREATKRKPFTKPTLEQVKLLAAKAGLPAVEAEKFYDYYESNGWKVGRNPMRSVGGAIGNWRRNWEERRNTGPRTLAQYSRPLTGAEQRAIGTETPKYDDLEAMLEAKAARDRMAKETSGR